MAKKFSWIKQASELHVSERYCTCCQKPLRGKVVMLERDCTRVSTDPHAFADGGIPEDRSQGWFPFGATCAANLTRVPA